MKEETEGYLLDTNHCAYILNAKGKPKNKQSLLESNTIQAISSRMEAVLHISEATLGELIYGAEYSTHKEANLRELKAFIEVVPPLLIDREVWQFFGKAKAQLRKAGKKIPDIDLLIASSAKRYHLTLVTNDKHLALLDDLPELFVKRENWAKPDKWT
ncbi:PilT-like protein [Beggiatoa sp. PS]|nr:PilT-like protein [Beggiatoa sp. PS]